MQELAPLLDHPRATNFRQRGMILAFDAVEPDASARLDLRAPLLHQRGRERTAAAPDRPHGLPDAAVCAGRGRDRRPGRAHAQGVRIGDREG
jgi:hypothetical protein